MTPWVSFFFKLDVPVGKENTLVWGLGQGHCYLEQNKMLPVNNLG